MEEARTRAAAAHQAAVLRTRGRGVEHNPDRVEDWVGRHNLRVVGVGRTVGEGEHRVDRHMDLVLEEGRTRMADQVVDSPIDHIGLEVGGHRKEHFDPGSRS